MPALRLSGRLKQLLSQHLADEEAVLERMQELATLLTVGGVRHTQLAEQQPAVSQLVCDVQQLQQRRMALREELARVSACPPQQVRLSRLDWTTPHETRDFQRRCDDLRKRAVRAATCLSVAGRTLAGWQRIALALLTEATGGTQAPERYTAAGRLVSGTPVIRLEARS